MKRTTFLILCLEGAILSFNVAAASALVPSISKEFAVSAFITGKIIWLYMLPYGVSALFYGPLVRVFDARKIELICFSLFSLANLLTGLSKNIVMLFGARFFMGVFGASVIPLTLILIAEHTEEKNRGRFVGAFFSATFVASLLGLFLSGFISWRMIFLIPAILGFILLVFMYFYLPPHQKFWCGGLPHFEQDRGEVKFNYIAAAKNKNILSVFSYIFLISLLYHGIQQWLAVYFSKGFCLNQFTISMLIALTSLSGIFGEIIGGWLSDIISRLRTINLGMILMILSTFLLLLKLPLALLALIMVMWGLGWTFNHAGLSALLTDLPKEFLNEAASLNSSVRFISGGIGVAIGGFFMQRNFMACFIIFGLSLVLLVLFNGIGKYIADTTENR